MIDYALMGVGIALLLGLAIVLSIRSNLQKDLDKLQKTEPLRSGLNDELRQIAYAYLRLLPAERTILVDLAYATCGFGPHGLHVQRTALYVDKQQWFAFRQAFGKLLGLPALPDTQQLHHPTIEQTVPQSENADPREEAAHDVHVGLLLICFAEYLTAVHDQLERRLRHDSLAVRLTDSSQALVRLSELQQPYQEVADDDRPFVIDLRTERQLAPIHLRYVQGALAYEVQRNLDCDLVEQLAIIAYAICGFGPCGETARALAQQQETGYIRNIWADFRSQFCIILQINLRVEHRDPFQVLLKASNGGESRLRHNNELRAFLAHYVFYLETIYSQLSSDQIYRLNLMDQTTLINALASLARCHEFAYPDYFNLFPTPVMTA